MRVSTLGQDILHGLINHLGGGRRDWLYDALRFASPEITGHYQPPSVADLAEYVIRSRGPSAVQRGYFAPAPEEVATPLQLRLAGDPYGCPGQSPGHPNDVWPLSHMTTPFHTLRQGPFERVYLALYLGLRNRGWRRADRRLALTVVRLLVALAFAAPLGWLLSLTPEGMPLTLTIAMAFLGGMCVLMLNSSHLREKLDAADYIVDFNYGLLRGALWLVQLRRAPAPPAEIS